MLNEKKNIVTALSSILPTYYELFVDSSINLPCITYLEEGSYNTAQGDTVGYQAVSFTIKVWGTDISTLADKFALVDDKMRTLGFTRNSYRELAANNTICFIGGYQALGREEYINEQE